MVRIENSNTITVMSYKINPVAYVNPGEVFIISTMDCFSNKITKKDILLKNIPWKDINPATGPIYVNGAEKGDVLHISILDIKVGERAVVLCETEDLDRYKHKAEEASLFSAILNERVVISDEISIRCRPMIGVIGVAPEKDDIPTTLPGIHGGNMDNKHIIRGCDVYLPVFHKGALLAIGDLHAAMGDGESTGSGYEIGGEVTLKIDIIKNCEMPLPMVKNKSSIETVASGKSLDEASVLAVKNMLKYLTVIQNYDYETAWKIVAACGDVGICQFANDIKTARCCIPIEHLNADIQ